METIKVAIVDDHDLFREGLISILTRNDQIQTVLEASDGLELLHLLPNCSVDVILMDLEMEGMDGIETSERVLDLYPNVKVLVLSMHNDERMITYMMESGVHGYLQKNTSIDELVNAIENVYQKGFYFNDDVSQALLSGIKRRKPSKPTFNHLSSLTSREKEILELICKELTTQEIADKLFISHRTVEGHRKNLMDKLNVKNTVGLVIKAIREEMVFL